MKKSGRIISVEPGYAIPGGEIEITCESLALSGAKGFACMIGEIKARIIGASPERVIAIVPEKAGQGAVDVQLVVDGQVRAASSVTVGKLLAGELHQVANPAVDPKDGSIILTRSGTRGQELPVTLFRCDDGGMLSEMRAKVMNPTGLAFDPHGRLIVTNRADGEVVQVNNDSEVVPLASDLGVATGIAFDREGVMFIGDRSGTIYRIPAFGEAESWALIEPSVSAFHIAFGPDGNLFVAAPGLCSYDVIYRIDKEGSDTIFFKGLGRPQGLAFDDKGYLYAAACLKGRHGIVRIEADGSRAEMFVAGMGIVGLCFTRKGEMLVATSDAVYSIDMNIQGTLLES